MKNVPLLTNRSEFVSRTQKPINRVHSDALRVRASGISALRECLAAAPLEHKGELISAMNFSVSEVTRELKKRTPVVRKGRA